MAAVAAFSLLAVAFLLLALARPAAAAAPLAGASVSPSRFVPDWNGQSDSTRVRVVLRARSVVTVSVRTTGGNRAVRVLARGRTLPAGTTDLYWDGRTAAGTVAGAGSYAVVVRVRPASSSGSSRTMQERSATTVQRLAVAVARPNVSVFGLRMRHAYVARRTSAGTARASFRLTARSNLSAAIAAADGTVVRNLARGSVRRGTVRVTWDGRADGGRRVADGSYLLLVSATAGGVPSATVRAPVLVDRTRPQLAPSTRLVAARVRRGRVLAAVRVRASEAGRLTFIARNGRRASVSLRAGSRRVAIPAAALGIRPTTRVVHARLRITYADRVANTTGDRIVVRVPAVARPAPPPPPPPPPVSTPGGALAWPTPGPVTSEFGPRWGRMHYGIDLGDPSGTPIRAAAGGVVSFAGTQGGYGNLVVLEHPGGLTTAYAHQSRMSVVAGQVVARGQVIGYVGNTGHSTGPHLHFETRVNGIAINPRRFLPPR